MTRLPALPLAASLLLLSTAASASVHSHRRSSSHAIVRRSAGGHTLHVHAAEHAAFSGMDTDRATQIQSALIQRGYLTGEPSGNWDGNSSTAMQKFQSDNGWQTKLVPDSRALIKLGLGPGSSAQPPAAPKADSAVSVPAASASATAAAGQTF